MHRMSEAIQEASSEPLMHLITFDLEKEIKHGIQVSNLAYRTGKMLGLEETMCHELAVAGILHDIGKLKLRNYITAEEKPLITEEELDALEPGDSVFHKAFGHGEIIEITSSSIIVAFSNDKTKSRTFMFPGTFYQGILQI